MELENILKRWHWKGSSLRERSINQWARQFEKPRVLEGDGTERTYELILGYLGGVQAGLGTTGLLNPLKGKKDSVCWTSVCPINLFIEKEPYALLLGTSRSTPFPSEAIKFWRSTSLKEGLGNQRGLVTEGQRTRGAMGSPQSRSHAWLPLDATQTRQSQRTQARKASGVICNRGNYFHLPRKYVSLFHTHTLIYL